MKRMITKERLREREREGKSKRKIRKKEMFTNKATRKIEKWKMERSGTLTDNDKKKKRHINQWIISNEKQNKTNGRKNRITLMIMIITSIILIIWITRKQQQQ